MVIADATILLLLLRPGTPVPGDKNGVPIPQAKERIDYLVNRLENDGTKIGIPTPALSEVLVRAGQATGDIIDKLNKYAVFDICDFDGLAAVEVAQMARQEIGRKRIDNATTWAKIKYDRQIVAIAKTKGATAIYSDDGDIRALANRAAIQVIGIAELPLPPERPKKGPLAGQADLFETLSRKTDIAEPAPIEPEPEP
jgi:predicted nucleic acid-binding protein